MSEAARPIRSKSPMPMKTLKIQMKADNSGYESKVPKMYSQSKCDLVTMYPGQMEDAK